MSEEIKFEAGTIDPDFKVELVKPMKKRPKRQRFESTMDVTQAEFDAALYGLGFNGAETYKMWQLFQRNGAVSVRLKKA